MKPATLEIECTDTEPLGMHAAFCTLVCGMTDRLAEMYGSVETGEFQDITECLRVWSSEGYGLIRRLETGGVHA